MGWKFYSWIFIYVVTSDIDERSLYSPNQQLNKPWKRIWNYNKRWTGRIIELPAYNSFFLNANTV